MADKIDFNNLPVDDVTLPDYLRNAPSGAEAEQMKARLNALITGPGKRSPDELDTIRRLQGQLYYSNQKAFAQEQHMWMRRAREMGLSGPQELKTLDAWARKQGRQVHQLSPEEIQDFRSQYNRNQDERKMEMHRSTIADLEQRNSQAGMVKDPLSGQLIPRDKAQEILSTMKQTAETLRRRAYGDGVSPEAGGMGMGLNGDIRAAQIDKDYNPSDAGARQRYRDKLAAGQQTVKDLNFLETQIAGYESQMQDGVEAQYRAQAEQYQRKQALERAQQKLRELEGKYAQPQAQPQPQVQGTPGPQGENGNLPTPPITIPNRPTSTGQVSTLPGTGNGSGGTVSTLPGSGNASDSTVSTVPGTYPPTLPGNPVMDGRREGQYGDVSAAAAGLARQMQTPATQPATKPDTRPLQTWDYSQTGANPHADVPAPVTEIQIGPSPKALEIPKMSGYSGGGVPTPPPVQQGDFIIGPERAALNGYTTDASGNTTSVPTPPVSGQYRNVGGAMTPEQYESMMSDYRTARHYGTTPGELDMARTRQQGINDERRLKNAAITGVEQQNQLNAAKVKAAELQNQNTEALLKGGMPQISIDTAKANLDAVRTNTEVLRQKGLDVSAMAKEQTRQVKVANDIQQKMLDSTADWTPEKKAVLAVKQGRYSALLQQQAEIIGAMKVPGNDPAKLKTAYDAVTNELKQLETEMVNLIGASDKPQKGGSGVVTTPPVTGGNNPLAETITVPISTPDEIAAAKKKLEQKQKQIDEYNSEKAQLEREKKKTFEESVGDINLKNKDAKKAGIIRGRNAQMFKGIMNNWFDQISKDKGKVNIAAQSLIDQNGVDAQQAIQFVNDVYEAAWIVKKYNGATSLMMEGKVSGLNQDQFKEFNGKVDWFNKVLGQYGLKMQFEGGWGTYYQEGSGMKHPEIHILTLEGERLL